MSRPNILHWRAFPTRPGRKPGAGSGAPKPAGSTLRRLGSGLGGAAQCGARKGYRSTQELGRAVQPVHLEALPVPDVEDVVRCW